MRNKWWLPGALLALAGLLFLGAAADAERPGVWVAIGAAFLAAGGLLRPLAVAPPRDGGVSPAPTA